MHSVKRWLSGFIYPDKNFYTLVLSMAVPGKIMGLPVFWVYFILKADNLCKTVWAMHRLKSGKWIKKIKKAGE